MIFRHVRRCRCRLPRVGGLLVFPIAISAMVAVLTTGVEATPFVTFSTIAANAYGNGDINSCAIQVNNLSTVGNFQFAAYYDTSRNIVIGRRTLGSSTWQTYSTGISVTASDIADDHDVIAAAVDSGGFMHLSWNMHNVSLNYSISAASVTTPTLNSISFVKQTAASAPTLFPSAGATTNEVTYPTFYNLPGSNNLLFTYRNGGAGGGSGNGNQYFDVYNPSTQTWTNQLVINGIQTNVNAYLNRLAFTSNKNMLMSWTWRSSPAFQTNSNIMFAQSPDSGTTWYQQGGATQYTLPIIQSGSPSTSVAQVIKNIPENSSLINQACMTVDNNDNPLIATWWAPTAGNPNRQYMLQYYTGSQWKTSQITNRASDTFVDTTGNSVRDLARPIVMVDKQNRVLVVTRSEDTSEGSFANPAVQNNIVVYYSTDLSSANPTWNSLTLDSASMGNWEPTYDTALWASQNKLDLFYEPSGLTGESTASAKVLEWDEQSFFASVPEPASMALPGLCALLSAWRPARSRQRVRAA